MGLILHFQEVKSFSKRNEKNQTVEAFFPIIFTKKNTLKFRDNIKKKVLKGIQNRFFFKLVMIYIGYW